LDKTGREVNMVFTPEGFSMIGTSSNITATKVEFGKEFFEEYAINGEKEEYGVVLNEITNALKQLAYNEIDIEGNADTITIIGNDTKYVMPIFVEADTLTEMPDIPFEHSVITTQNALLEGVGKMSLINNDAIKLFIENKKLKMKSAAQIRKIETEICDAPDIELSVFIAKKLLGDSLVTNNDEITLYIGKDLPLSFTIDRPGLKVRTVIAPRVEENF